MSAQPSEPKPFACPECGGTDWKADYYEAVWQSIRLLDVGGEPLFDDYTGSGGTYDDSGGEDEAYLCRACGFKIELGTFVLVPPEAENAKAAAALLVELREACEYDPEADSPVDNLIDYKNALEDTLGRVVAARGVPPWSVAGGPQEPS